MNTLSVLAFVVAIISATCLDRERLSASRSPERPNLVFAAAKHRQLSVPVDCTADNPQYIGDGFCDSIYNTPDCGFDGGDCCESTCYLNRLTEGSKNGCLTEFNCIDPMVLDPHKSRTSGGTTNALLSLKLDPHRGWTSGEETSAGGEWKLSTELPRDHAPHSPELNPHRSWANEDETKAGGVPQKSSSSVRDHALHSQEFNLHRSRTEGEESRESNTGGELQRSTPHPPALDPRRNKTEGEESSAGGELQKSAAALKKGTNHVPLDTGYGGIQQDWMPIFIGGAISVLFVICIIFLIQRSKKNDRQSPKDHDSQRHRHQNPTARSASLRLSDDLELLEVLGSKPKPVGRALSVPFAHLEKPNLASNVSGGSTYSKAMSFVVDDPELWKEFQDTCRLKASKGGSGNMSARELLREFVKEKGLEPTEEIIGPMAFLRSVSDSNERFFKEPCRGQAHIVGARVQ